MESTPRTDIDRRTCKRVVPMRVMCAGLPRTGTTSLRAALIRLGFDDTYHMRSLLFENLRDGEMWRDAINAKYEGIGTFEKEDWDQLLGHCQAVCDVPCVLFVPELVKAYPEAKVVLNTRDVEAWYKSMSRTVDPALRQVAERDPSTYENPTEVVAHHAVIKMWKEMFQGSFPDNGRDVFHKHYDMVRQLVPKENLLEYSVKEGWNPLCEFLGVPIPDEPFPRLNDSEAFAEKAKEIGVELQGES